MNIINDDFNLIEKIKETIKDKNCKSIDIFVGYISLSGLLYFTNNFKDVKLNFHLGKKYFINTKVNIKDSNEIPFNSREDYISRDDDENLLVRFDNHTSIQEVNELMKDNKISIYKLHHKNSSSFIDQDDVFHSKIYVINLEDSRYKIVGSHNLTINSLNNEFSKGEYKFNESSLIVKTDDNDTLLNELDEIIKGNSKFYNRRRVEDINELIDPNMSETNDFSEFIADSVSKRRSTTNKYLNNYKEEIEQKIQEVFKDNLKDYQYESVEKIFKMLIEYGGSFLNLPTGMGKTRVALAIFYIWRFIRDEQVAILMPNSDLFTQWKEDWDSMLDYDEDNKDEEVTSELSDNVWISYRTSKLDDPTSNNYRKLRSMIRNSSLIIVEESHNLRNTGSKNLSILDRINAIIESTAAKTGKRPSVLNVTATPINNSLTDLANQISLFPIELKIKDSIPKSESTILEQFPNRDEAIELINEIGEVFTKYTKEYKKKVDSDPEINRKALLSKYWKKSKEELSSSKRYKEYLDYLELIITSASSDKRIDMDFDPVKNEEQLKEITYGINDSLVKDFIDLVESTAFSLESEEEIIDELQSDVDFMMTDGSTEKEIEKTLGKNVMGSTTGATSITKLSLLKSLESSPLATVKMIENFVEKWTSALNDESILDEYIVSQIAAEDRSHKNSNSNETYEERFERKKKEKGDWLVHIFKKYLENGTYDDMSSILKKIQFKKSIGDDDIITASNISDYFYEGSKEIALYNELAEQFNKKLNIYEKTIIFSHFKETAIHLENVISKFDFIIEYNNDKEIPSSVLLTKSNSESYLNEFARFSKDLEFVRKYSNKNYDDRVSLVLENHRKSPSFIICTDEFAEGYNMQDGIKLISFDTHWNPMRVLQRVGRIIRVMNTSLIDNIRNVQETNKKIRYFWLDSDEIYKHVDLRRIISFKMMSIVSSSFDYAVTFNSIIENGDKREDEIRKMISESQKAGNRFIDTDRKEQSNLKPKGYGDWEAILEKKDLLNNELLFKSNKKTNFYLNNTHIYIQDNINYDNCQIIFAILINNKREIVEIEKNKKTYIPSSLTSGEINDIKGMLYYETLDSERAIMPSFVNEDYDLIEEAIKESLIARGNNQGINIDYVSIYIRNKNEK